MATKVPDNLENLSDEKLQALWESVAEEALERREANVRVAREVSRRETERAAREKFESMSNVERAALAQLFEVEGIESQEAVNNG